METKEARYEHSLTPRGSQVVPCCVQKLSKAGLQHLPVIAGKAREITNLQGTTWGTSEL